MVGVEERHGHLDNGVGRADVPQADLRRILKPVPIAERYLEIQRINQYQAKTFDQKRRIKIISENFVLPSLRTILKPLGPYGTQKILVLKGSERLEVYKSLQSGQFSRTNTSLSIPVC